LCKYDRDAKGEQGHGISARMINKEMLYHLTIVSNFVNDSVFLFAFAEPVVSNTIAASIPDI
jgi:hypothetical protein